MHGLNGLKYISTVVALIMRTTNEFHKGMVWKILAASSSSIATIVNTYWDIVIDWGLLRRNSRNPWLRDKLSVPYKSVYFVAMVSYFVANMLLLSIYFLSANVYISIFRLKCILVHLTSEMRFQSPISKSGILVPQFLNLTRTLLQHFVFQFHVSICEHVSMKSTVSSLN